MIEFESSATVYLQILKFIVVTNEMDANTVYTQGFSTRAVLLKVASESFLGPIPDLRNQTLGIRATASQKIVPALSLAFPKPRKGIFFSSKLEIHLLGT